MPVEDPDRHPDQPSPPGQGAKRAVLVISLLILFALILGVLLISTS